MFLNSFHLPPTTSSTPAPQGTRATAHVLARPDGWNLVDGPTIRRLGAHVDRALVSLTQKASRGVTRRRFLGGLGAAGLAVGVGISLAGRPARAGDPEPQMPHFNNCQSQNGCSGYELCPDTNCNDNKQCDVNEECNGGVSTRRQVYASRNCGGGSADNCWTECCGGTKKRCCDCCSCRVLGSGTCINSTCPNPGPHYNCLCRRNTGPNC